MEARYFYERLIKYPEESWKTRKYYYGYSNRKVEIHHKNNDSEWYTIHSDGLVTKNTIDGNYERDFCSIDDLVGDDFELFSIVQIIKSGYLVLQENNTGTYINDMRVLVSRLHSYIDSLDDNYSLFSDGHTDIPRLCGGSAWTNGLTDYITYHSVNDIELHVRTIKNLCRENVERKYYDARPIPFIKSIDSEISIHVSFVHNMNKNDYEETRKKCNEVLKDLFRYMDIINIKCKWEDCKMRYPIFL